jgi:peptidyl-tRNA hydrolase, PTH1 family
MRQRRGTPISYLIVGLGNPGREYARTRHNVGAEAVELLAQRMSGSLKASRSKASVAEMGSVVLAVPTVYMNESGESVGSLARKYAVSAENIVIVHDELDLEPGTVKVKVGGGLAGHNGLRSINQHIKSQEFVRVRIGIGKPRTKELGADHVLKRVPLQERQVLDDAVARAADALEAIIARGADVAMREYNAT